MANGHPYGFNMGHGQIIHFNDYREAAKALMERNMPEVVHDTQTKALFLPETHLPKMPRLVDLEEFERKKESFTDEELQFLRMTKGKEDLDNAAGDIVEKELSEELKKFYERSGKTKVVVLQGCTLRKGRRGGNQENDFVIVDFDCKTVICIECKVTLTSSTGHKAVKQTLELKSLLEEYFTTELASGQWLFVGMIFTKYINTITKDRLCPSCPLFVIKGSSEVHAKLIALENDLKKRSFSRSHPEFVSLTQGLVFVVLSQPVSTYCTIADSVYDKVVGKPAMGNKKAKAGQGDFQSIIFWTMRQANIMLTERQFVLFISSWSTGKTICMREKAVMWATQNPTKKLFFVVVRYIRSYRTSLLEMELKDFFQQHNLQNVEVIGLPTMPKDTLSILLQEVTTRPKGCSFMVDELVVPDPEHHQEQFTKQLEQLQNHFEKQPAKPSIWIACAGIDKGKAEHFKRSYLISILSPAFHLPEMDVPLRNTKQTLTMAGLEANTGVKVLDSTISTITNPVYTLPENLMEGVTGIEFLVNNVKDKKEITRVVKEATEHVLGRAGGAGFPLLGGVDSSALSAVKRGVEKAGAKALVYHKGLPMQCTEVEVEEWMRKRRSGQEERVLIADEFVSRGWESSHVLVVEFRRGLFRSGLENLVMRTVGYCALVRAKSKIEQQKFH